MKNPYRATVFSVLLPGLGQLYLGERAKAWTLFCMDIGVVTSLILSHTVIAWIMMGGIYLAIVIPSAIDAFQTAAGRPRTFSVPMATWTGESIPYVIVMLLMVGPFAIPLLWGSSKFSRTAKVVWTLAVILIAILAIATLSFFASFLDRILR